MGFGLISDNGKSKPIVLCDNCKKPIQKAEEGVIVWEGEEDFLIYHKGNCDNREKSKSMDLDVYLEYIDSNCKRNKEQAKEKAEISEQF